MNVAVSLPSKININKLNPQKFEKEKTPYTLIANKVIENCSNHTAGFIWLYLQSRIETWVPNKFEIMKRFKICERTYKKHMSYLVKSGLIQYQQYRKEDGTLGPISIVVLNGSNFKEWVAVDNFVENDKTHDASTNETNNSLKSIAYVRSANICTPDNLTKNVLSPQCKKTAVQKNAPLNNTRINNNTKNKPPIFPLPGEIGNVGKISLSEKNKSKTTKTKTTTAKVKREKIEGILGLQDLLADNPHNVPNQMLSDWMVLRKDNKRTLTKSVWDHTNGVMTRLVNKNTCPIECFQYMLVKGWYGMQFDYFKKQVEAANQKQFNHAYKPYNDYQQTKNEIAFREELALKEKREEIISAKNFTLALQEKASSENKENGTPKRSLSAVYNEILLKQSKFGH